MAGLSALVALAAALTLWLVVVRDDTYVAPAPGRAATDISAGGAAVTLAALQDAIGSRDRGAAAALADGGTPAVDAVTAAVDNARAIDVTDVTLRYVDEVPDGPATVDGAWSAAVATTWRYRGFDATTARAEVRFTFRTVGSDVAIVSIGGGDQRTPVWLAGPVEVRRTTDWMVVAAEPRDLDRYAQLAADAVPVVERVVTTWRPRLVVEVPVGLGGLAAALDADPADYTAIAAVTATSDGTVAPRSVPHVFVNPDVLEAVDSTGAQVVISHEATHVATDGPASLAPTWLIEGIADYVALRDVRLPVSVTAAQVIAQVQSEGLPRQLPDATTFDPTQPHLGASYEAAWLACVVLAERGGDASLLSLYDEVSDGADLEATLDRLLGWSDRDLVRAWRARLRDLAER